jgi:hypothetical protein
MVGQRNEQRFNHAAAVRVRIESLESCGFPRLDD